jgi:hypothetical protein
MRNEPRREKHRKSPVDLHRTTDLLDSSTVDGKRSIADRKSVLESESTFQGDCPMKIQLCFIDLGVATVETRESTIPIATDDLALLFP